MSKIEFQSIRIKAYVLSISHKTRNLQLMSDLKNVISAEIVRGFDGSKNPELLQDIDITISKKLQNRSLNFNEIACAQGHRKMVLRAAQEDLDVAFFLEDDAILPTQFDVQRIAARLKASEAAICLISYEEENVLSFRLKRGPLQGFGKCLSLPTCAQFYAINRKGLELLSSEWQLRECSEVADFPTWYWDKVIFFLSPLDVRAIVARESSTIHESRLKVKSSSFTNRVIRYSCLTWFLYFRDNLSISAYMAFIHGRLLNSILQRFKVILR